MFICVNILSIARYCTRNCNGLVCRWWPLSLPAAAPGNGTGGLSAGLVTLQLVVNCGGPGCSTCVSWAAGRHCAETTAHFNSSRKWQTPATLKLPILSLRKLVRVCPYQCNTCKKKKFLDSQRSLHQQSRSDHSVALFA